MDVEKIYKKIINTDKSCTIKTNYIGPEIDKGKIHNASKTRYTTMDGLRKILHNGRRLEHTTESRGKAEFAKYTDDINKIEIEFLSFKYENRNIITINIKYREEQPTEIIHTINNYLTGKKFEPKSYILKTR